MIFGYFVCSRRKDAFPHVIHAVTVGYHLGILFQTAIAVIAVDGVPDRFKGFYTNHLSGLQIQIHDPLAKRRLSRHNLSARLGMDPRESEQAAPEVVVTLGDILFECPHCDKSMVIDESATGMVVECPQCHTNVIVPSRPPALVEGEQPENPNELLLLAAQMGDSDGVGRALAQGADVNTANSDGMTALMFAVQQGSEDCVQRLISRGANLEARREDGQTAATLAQHANHFQIVRLLWKASGK